MEAILQMTMKKKVLYPIVLVIFLLAFFVSVSLVSAQEPLPTNGYHNETSDTSSKDPLVEPVLKIPSLIPEDREFLNSLRADDPEYLNDSVDNFGYTMDETVPLDWVDATSSGINTGMSGPSNGQYSGPINLGFTFPYYENSYSQVYIAASGYLSFSNSETWPFQSQIPTDAEPNNVIAPYWAPLFLSQFGPAGQVYYLTEGDAPNKYFVVEWYEVTEGVQNAPIAGEDIYHFQVILYENGDIRFQYKLMEYTSEDLCGSSGIEDSTGNDGLTYLPVCSPATSYTAVLFSRPGPSARLRVSPKYQSQFVSPSESRTFPITITNLGNLGSEDIFELSVTSDWAYRLLSEDGQAQLTDTNSDGFVDTGSVSEGEAFTFFVEITAPVQIGVGAWGNLSLRVTSSLDSSVYQMVTCQVAVPARFSQIFRDDADGAMSMMFAQPNQVHTVQATNQAWWGYNPVVAETKSGNFIALWQRWLTYDNYQSFFSVLEFTIIDKSGETLIPVTELVSNASSGLTAYDEEPVLDVAPDGMIGIAWRRRLVRNDAEGLQENWNLFFLLMDEDGQIFEGPINVTQNEGWYQSNSLNYDVPRFWDPQIKANEQNYFGLTWRREMDLAPIEFCDEACKLDDIYYAIYDTTGMPIKMRTKLTSDSALDSEAYANPSITSLTDDRWIVVYSHTQGGMAFSILTDTGNLLQGNSFIGSTRTGFSPVILQTLESNHIIIAYTAWTIKNPEIHVLVLNSETYKLISEPIVLANSAATTGGDFASITQDSQGNVILTWMDFSANSRQHLYYALLDLTGNILTPPMIYKSANNPINGNPRVESGLTGYSNSTNRQFQDVGMTYWAINWIERLFDSGITTGCQVDPPLFCPQNTTTRAQMAVFLGRVIYGADYEPPIVDDQVFTDVPVEYWASSWIHKLYADGITRGCSSDPLGYCPDQKISRAEMAVFLVRILYGYDYVPPEATGLFIDVPTSQWAAAEIEQLYRDGVTTGCGTSPLRFCPDGSTTRAEIAAFLVRTFDLP